MRWIAAVLLPLLVLSPFREGTAADAPSIEVRAQYVPLDAANWDADVVGRLRYRGGVRLTSPDSRFGGLSGLMIAADGLEFTAVSDRGKWVRGRLTYNADGNLSGVAHVTMELIRGADGRPLVGARGDAESLSPAPMSTRGAVVAFERVPRLRIYLDGEGYPMALPTPDGIEQAPPNNGMEAVTRLSDGRLLVVTEYAEEGGRFVGWIGGADGWSRVTYICDQGFKPTGATTLANGNVVFVERRFPLLSVRVRMAAAMKPGAVIEAEELARFEGSRTFDNMEGVDARQGPNGETLIYLVSDDNFRRFQRTLLMMYELIK